MLVVRALSDILAAGKLTPPAETVSPLERVVTPLAASVIDATVLEIATDAVSAPAVLANVILAGFILLVSALLRGWKLNEALGEPVGAALL
jgi:hypothetical protein